MRWIQPHGLAQERVTKHYLIERGPLVNEDHWSHVQKSPLWTKCRISPELYFCVVIVAIKMFYFKATLEPFCITPDRQKNKTHIWRGSQYRGNEITTVKLCKSFLCIQKKRKICVIVAMQACGLWRGRKKIRLNRAVWTFLTQSVFACTSIKLQEQES